MMNEKIHVVTETLTPTWNNKEPHNGDKKVRIVLIGTIDNITRVYEQLLHDTGYETEKETGLGEIK